MWANLTGLRSSVLGQGVKGVRAFLVGCGCRQDVSWCGKIRFGVQALSVMDGLGRIHNQYQHFIFECCMRRMCISALPLLPQHYDKGPPEGPWHLHLSLILNPIP